MPDPQDQGKFFPESSSSIFWVETNRIQPNPYQPRKEFREEALKDLADSIRQYGVLQPLVVTRKEVEREDGGISSEYELIAGERRLRASKIAGLARVPVIIRVGEDSDKTKLEIAIVENVQREDLNPIDRARAFHQLYEQFGYKHGEIGKKVGRSREYVTNSIRLLQLPQQVIDSLVSGRIGEGHARSLLMLSERPDEQMTLYKEILFKGLTVREAEMAGRKIAYEKVRKHYSRLDPGILELEEKLTEKLGTRVQIEKKQHGGKIVIDYFSSDDLQNLVDMVSRVTAKGLAIKDPTRSLEPVVELTPEEKAEIEAVNPTPLASDPALVSEPTHMEQTDEELYSLKNFSV